MRDIPIVRKLMKLWSGSVERRDFRSLYSLAAVEACIAIGPWTLGYYLLNGSYWDGDSRDYATNSVFTQTRLGPLTLVQYYAPREPDTKVSHDSLKPVSSPGLIP
jgi:hypothetical protein